VISFVVCTVYLCGRNSSRSRSTSTTTYPYQWMLQSVRFGSQHCTKVHEH